MSDKTFLQELQSIKRKLETIHSFMPQGSGMGESISKVIEDVQSMINQCLEIQIAMMKQGIMNDAKG